MPDIERTVTNEIVSFMHCRMCLDERPSNLSPREYGDLEQVALHLLILGINFLAL